MANRKFKRILVCGGRRFSDRDLLFRTLDRLAKGCEVVIEGGASGADLLAAQWAWERGKSVEEYRAQWHDFNPPVSIKYNRWGRPYNAAAGLRRNQKMLDEGRPEVVLAFPGGKGTADMVRRALRGGVRVIHIAANGGTRDEEGDGENQQGKTE